MTKKKLRIQANANECVRNTSRTRDLDYPLNHVSRLLGLQIEDTRIEGRDDGNQALCLDVSNLVEGLEHFISKTGDSDISNAHDLNVLWNLMQANQWGIKREENVKDMDSDETVEGECSILEESLVLVGQNEGNVSGSQ